MASWAAVAKRTITEDRTPNSNRHTLHVRNDAEHIGRKTPSKFRTPKKQQGDY